MHTCPLSPLLLGAISTGHSFTQVGGLVRFFLAFEFPAHGDPLRRDAIPVFSPPLIGIITGKYEMMAGKRKKKPMLKMTEISVSADGDSGETKMTETPYQ